MDIKAVEDVYPLSPMQAGMLFHTLERPGEGLYFEQLSCSFEGELSIEAFRGAWHRLIERQPVLRTSFLWEGLNEPAQIVMRSVELPWDELDWRDADEPEQRRRFADLLERDRARGFDLARAPLMRLTLMRLADRKTAFVWSHHHLLLDGWSLPLLLKEVMLLYEGLVRGEQPPLDPPRPYRDYITWLRSRDAAEAEAHWRRVLRGFREPTGFAPMRAGGPRVGTAYHDRRSLRLSRETTSALESSAQRRQLTLNTLIQGAWALLLGRYSGKSDVVFGATVSGRSAPLSGIESMIGLFINALPVRAEIRPRTPLPEWLADLQAAQFSARQYEYCALTDIQGWSEVRRGAPLFTTLLAFENYPVDRSMRHSVGGSIGVEDVEIHERTNYPISVFAIPGPELTLTVAYDAGLVDSSTVERMLDHLRNLVSGMADCFDAPIGRIPMLSREERSHLLTDLAAGPAAREADRCAHERVLEQADRDPDRVAVVAEGAHLSYGELGRRVRVLARRLVEAGVGPETPVGIAVERDLSMVVGVVGILASGGCYVPLDPDHPRERLGFMLADAGVSLLVTTREAAERSGVAAERTLYLDDGLVDVAAGDRAWSPGVVTRERLAYVIYTSGSTGRPKGVAVPHGALSNFLESMRREPGMSSEDVLCAVTTLGFDISGLELLLPLVSGGRVELATRATASDGERLAALLVRSGATVMQATPATWSLLVGSGWEGRAGLKALCGGEALGRDLADRLSDRVAALWNVYGPTETTIWSTVSLVRRASAVVSIGRPIAATTAYVLDGELEPVPVGVPGMLYIGGAGLSRGYLGRAGLTASSFVPDGLGGVPGGRLYCTGDLARWTEDGTLEYLGRVDDQVKVRGFRIEPGEIEATLREHPAVRDAVVAARDGRGGERRLVAWLVARTAGPAAGRADVGELRAYLAGRLPAYMIPSSFVWLDRLPLGPSGKVDRRELPDPDGDRPDLAADYAPPRTPGEERLAEIWSEVLGVDRVGVHDDFFELGGHSLMATRLVSRIRGAFDVEIPLGEMIDAATVAEQAIVLQRASTRAALPPIEPIARGAEPPLSFAQQRLWFLDQLAPGNPFYIVPAAVRLLGPLDVAALRRCFRELSRRHETLRTTFSARGGRAVQHVHDRMTPALHAVDLSHVPEERRDPEVLRFAEAEAREPFDLSTGPLLRVRIVRCAADDHVVMMTMHHIVSDAWSLGVMVAEIATLYGAFAAGRSSPLQPLPIQYADFAAWQRDTFRDDALDAQLGYWKERLSNLPVLRLPTDRPRPAAQSYRGAAFGFDLPGELVGSVRRLGRSEGSTLFMALLAGFQALLARYSGQDDVVVGTPIANRTRAELEGLIGFFVNTLVMRSDLSGDPGFRELLGRMREVALGGYAHQDLPLERLVEELQPERDLAREPLFQVMFAMQNTPVPALDVPGGLQVRPLDLHNRTSKFDLTLFLWEVEDGVRGLAEYSTDLFDGTTVAAMMAQYRTLLEQAVRHPERPLSTLSLLSGDGRRQVVDEWGHAGAERPREVWTGPAAGNGPDVEEGIL